MAAGTTSSEQQFAPRTSRNMRSPWVARRRYCCAGFSTLFIFNISHLRGAIVGKFRETKG